MSGLYNLSSRMAGCKLQGLKREREREREREKEKGESKSCCLTVNRKVGYGRMGI